MIFAVKRTIKLILRVTYTISYISTDKQSYYINFVTFYDNFLKLWFKLWYAAIFARYNILIIEALAFQMVMD